MMAKPMWAGFVSAIVLALICTGVYAFNERSHVAEAQSGTTVGVDAYPTGGNTATSLGTINSCISVISTPPDNTFSIDLVIQDVMNLNSWEVTFRFDESLLQVNSLAVDGFFLGSSLWPPIFDCDAGQCQIGTFDTTDAGHDDEGVLARLDITAIGTGISRANLDLREEEPPFAASGVILEDANGTDIEPVDEHGFFDGIILNAEIRVDQPCGGCQPDVDTDGDGFDDDVECYLPTDPLDDCPDDDSHDAWPLDMDMSTVINLTGDAAKYSGNIGKSVGSDPALRRLDLDMSSVINLTGDAAKYAGHIGDTCS